MEKLLAKSPKTRSDGTPKEVTLLEHTRDVVDAANALFGIEHPTRLSERWLEFFKIPNEWITFRRNLIAACALGTCVGMAVDALLKLKTPEASP